MRRNLCLCVTLALHACSNTAGDPRDVRLQDVPIVFPKDVTYDLRDHLEVLGEDAQSGPADDGLSPPDCCGPEATGQEGLLDPGVVQPDTQTESVCVPACAGKSCGSDGCGGSCGKCTAPQTCIAGQCVCIPDCSGKECGDDGCGGDCAKVPCPLGCTPPPTPGSKGAPEFKCMRDGPCKKAAELVCSDLYRTGDIGYGGSDFLDIYACAAVPAHGPEKAYRFVPDQDGEVTFTLEDPQFPYMNLYLLKQQGSECTSKDCVASSHTSLTMKVAKGDLLWVVVDSTENNSGSYTLRIDCSWYVPPPR